MLQFLAKTNKVVHLCLVIALKETFVWHMVVRIGWGYLYMKEAFLMEFFLLLFSYLFKIEQ